MAKKKEVKNERAKPGSGEKHDKHAPTTPAENAETSENENADD